MTHLIKPKTAYLLNLVSGMDCVDCSLKSKISDTYTQKEYTYTETWLCGNDKKKPANDALAPLNQGLHPKLFSPTSLNSLLHSSMWTPRMLGNHVRILHNYNYLMDAQNANKPPLIASLDSPLKLA